MPPCSTVLIDMRGKADRHERTRTAMILIGYEAMNRSSQTRCALVSPGLRRLLKIK